MKSNCDENLANLDFEITVSFARSKTAHLENQEVQESNELGSKSVCLIIT